MQIHFTGRNIEITPALKTFTTEKMERLHSRHQNIASVNVTFHIENVTHIAEASVHLNHSDIHASAKADDMYAAIDMMVDKLISQITKHKEKTIDGHQ
jgi:putative sigma-54 modulation protein